MGIAGPDVVRAATSPPGTEDLLMAMIRLAVALFPLAIGGASAQSPAPQPSEPARPAVTAAAACVGERARAAAEDTTPGILQSLTREALALCLSGQAVPVRQAGTGR
jgi:hypothetical protein